MTTKIKTGLSKKEVIDFIESMKLPAKLYAIQIDKTLIITKLEESEE